MTTILTAAEAATVLRCETTDAEMLALLPLVDAYIQNATGRDWTLDAVIRPEAKAAARILLVRWHEDPGAVSGNPGTLGPALTACLVQLEALALQYTEFKGRNGVGACVLKGARVGDTVSTLTGLIGATGDQHAAFESIITVADQIQQVSSSDLSANWYRAHLIPVGSL